MPVVDTFITLTVILPSYTFVKAYQLTRASLGAQIVESACSAGAWSWTPGLGRSPGEGKGCPLRHPRLENPMNGGAWWATVHGVA